MRTLYLTQCTCGRPLAAVRYGESHAVSWLPVDNGTVHLDALPIPVSYTHLTLPTSDLV